MHSLLQRCTLTGIDQSTDTSMLWSLSDRYPFAEFGVLFSVSQQGRGRYPLLEWIEELAYLVRQRPGPQLALHVCGRAVTDFLDAMIDGDTRGPYAGDFRHLLDVFSRVQLNLRATDTAAAGISQALKCYPHHTFITQHHSANEDLTRALSGEDRHAALFDASGGRGKSPLRWPAALRNKYCGYAGGLGPDNLQEELRVIEKAAGGAAFWVDMEGKLRDDQDRFDMSRAVKCLEIVDEHRMVYGTRAVFRQTM